MASQKEIKAKGIRDAVNLLKKENYSITKPNHFKCQKCEKERSIKEYDNWYQSNNDELLKGVPVIPICKKCLKELWEKYVIDSNGDRKLGTYRLMQEIRIPWNEVLWEMADNTKRGTKWGTYIGKYNSLPQYKHLTMQDSDVYKGDTNNIQKTEIIDSKHISKKKKEELVLKWGGNRNDDEYIFLDHEYTQWTTRHKCDEYSEEILYAQIALKQLEIRKGRDNNENVDKQIDALQKLMKDANVKPIDMDASKNTENINALGVWLMEIEKYRPAEYFENKKLYEDVDGIKEYCDRFILRPLKNLLTGSRDFDFLYNLEDSKVEEKSYQTEGDNNELT